MKKNGGITLVALVVTIVVLLILAGITITYVMGNNSIFQKALDAKIQTEIERLRERIEIIQSDWWIDKKLDPTVTLDDFWKRLMDDNIITSKDDIEGPEKNGDNDIYLLDTTEGYIVEVIITPDGEVIIGNIVPEDSLPPKVREVKVTNKTSNSISVEVTIARLEDGKLSYYYKKEEETEYHELEDRIKVTDLTATYTELEQNKVYNIKVIAENKKGKSELVVNVLTGELEVGIIRQKGETIWNNNKASIELETTNTNLTLKYQINGIDGTWQNYEGAIGNLDHEDTVYAVLTDGTNYGDVATIVVRDGTAPTVTAATGTITTNSIAVTVVATDGEWGMPTSSSYRYFIKKSSETAYQVAKYTGTDTSYTFTGLIQNTSYDIKVTVNDKAQNEGSGTVSNIITGTVGGATGDLTTGNIIASSPTWASGKASITLSTTSGLQIQWQKNSISGTWTTGTSVTGLSHNDTVYARLWDGTNGGSEASVTIKDGTAPTNATVVLGATTANTGVNVTATVTHNDAQSGPKIASCKWVYNTIAGKIGTTASSYTGGTFSSNGQTINLNTSNPGTYYLHVLTTDNGNNVWETVSSGITVRQLATGITVSPTSASLNIGKTQQLTATVTPTNTSDKAVTWTSSNTGIATVSNTGLVTAKAAGTATITVKTNDGSNKSAICTIAVKEPTVADIVGETQTNNKTIQDENGNKITIPGGFKVVPNGGTDDASKVEYTYNGNGTPAVQDGIVIEDGEGNQFVWIPVGNIKNKDGTTTTITLGRYAFNTTNGTPTLRQNADNYAQTVAINSYYQELTTNSDNIAAKSLSTFVSKTNNNGGYYLGRYEASKGSDGKVDSQYDKAPWVYINQQNAATVAQGMYNSSYVDSDLINSYSWDTAIVFIQKYSEDSNYANKKPVNSSKLNTGKAGDKVCNIHDIASNCFEWSTEHSSFEDRDGSVYRFTCRGGRFVNNYGYAALRYSSVSASNIHYCTFRPLVYLK